MTFINNVDINKLNNIAIITNNNYELLIVILFWFFTAKDSLFLVNTSHNGAQIYDLIAPSTSECKM